MKKLISREYFENYAGRGLAYNKVWKEHSYYDECCDLFAREGAPPIKSLCVLGASTGLVLKEFEKRLKVKAQGCEINEWAHSQIPAAYKKRIRCEDMSTYIQTAKKDKKHFDLVFANSLIYLPMKDVKPFLKKLSKVTHYLHFRSSFREGYCPDEFRSVLKPYAWWNKVISENGFELFKWGRARTYCWKSI